MNNREKLKDKQRIVVKVGTSSLIHKATGNINLFRLEKLVRVLTDLHNSGKDVILVSSGAIGVGFKALGLENRPTSLPMKQACSAVGQGQLMMIYQKLFAEYNRTEMRANPVLYWGGDVNDLQEIKSRGYTFELDNVFNIVYIDAYVDLYGLF